MKALWQGKPMVLIPGGVISPGVAARAQALGVAEVVPCAEATADTIGAAVKRSLAGKQLARNAARHSARLRATNPPATAAAHLESLLA
jgi:UDP:flavonoid glycosyltransferase YjiC (YdhE family)